MIQTATRPTTDNWHAELIADEIRKNSRWDTSTRRREVTMGLGVTIDVEQDDRLPVRLTVNIDGQRFLCRHVRTSWAPSREFAVECGRATFSIEEV